MENVEEEAEAVDDDQFLLRMICSMRQWQSVEGAAAVELIRGKNNDISRFLKSGTSNQFIFGLPHIICAVTDYDAKTLTKTLNEKLVCVTVNVATEDDLQEALLKKKITKKF